MVGRTQRNIMGLISNHLIRSMTSHRNISATLVSNHLIRSISSNSNSNSPRERFLVSRSCRETGTKYYSLLSNENENENEKLACIHDFRSSSLERMTAGLGSCNGVVHLCNGNGKLDLLWSPSTNEFKVLPPSKLVCPDPHLGNYIMYIGRGFGFDAKSGDYKVLRFGCILFFNEYGDLTKTETQSELYSLRDNSWKEMILDGLDESPCFFSRAYVNGCYYWEREWPNHWETLISFDFATESFSEFPLPRDAKFELPRRDEYITKLVNFDGSLGTLVYERSEDVKSKSFELWVMKKESQSWSRELEFGVAGANKALAFSGDGRLLFLLGTDGQLLVYDLSVGELTKFDIYDSSLCQHMQVIPCTTPPPPSRSIPFRPNKLIAITMLHGFLLFYIF